MLTRRRNSKRLQSRHGDGKFRQPSLAQDFGIHAPVCAHCKSFNPHNVGEPRPERCHHCGEPLVDVLEKAQADALANAKANAEADVLAAIEESAASGQTVTRPWDAAWVTVLRTKAPFPFEPPNRRYAEFGGTSSGRRWNIKLVDPK